MDMNGRDGQLGPGPRLGLPRLWLRSWIGLAVMTGALGCSPPPAEWPALEPVRLVRTPPPRGRLVFPSTYEAFLEGQLAYNDQRYEDAYLRFRAALRTDPDSAYLHTWVARAQLALGRIEEARESIDEALEIDGCSEFALCTAADILVEQGDLDTALRTLRRAIECEPRQPDAYYQLAALLERRDAPQRAAEVYRSLLALRPRQAEAHRELARIALARGAPDEAAQHLAEVLRLEPWRADVVRQLARLRYEGGDLTSARLLLESALGHTPRDDETRGLLIRVLLASGDTARAAYHIRQLRPAEDDPRQLSEMGRLFLEANRPEAAEGEARRALALDGSHPAAALVLVGALRRQGRIDEAVEALSRFDADQPEADAAARQAALGLWEAGRLDQARSLLQEQLDAEPRSPRSRELLARLLERQGHADQAEALLLAGADPGDAVALGALLIRLGRARRAVTVLEDIGDEDLAESPRRLRLLAQALLESGQRLEQAEEIAQRASRLAPVDARIEALRGALAAAQGRAEPGLALLRRAVRLRPGDPWIRAQLALTLQGLGQCEAAVEAAREGLRFRPPERFLPALRELADGACAPAPPRAARSGSGE